MEGGELVHHALVLLLLVGVDGLCMLAKVVETRKLLAAVASEGPLAGVFPDVPGKMFASAEDHPALAIAPALERLGGGGTIALVDAGASGGRGGGSSGSGGGRDVRGDDGHGYVVVVVVVVVVSGKDEVRRELDVLRGFLGVHCPVRRGSSNLKGA